MIIFYSEYPDDLHDEHLDYPLAPERISVKPNDLSPKQLEILKTLHEQRGDTDEFQAKESHEKLIPNLRNNEKYIVHYRNLKLYLSLG